MNLGESSDKGAQPRRFRHEQFPLNLRSFTLRKVPGFYDVLGTPPEGLSPSLWEESGVLPSLPGALFSVTGMPRHLLLQVLPYPRRLP